MSTDHLHLNRAFNSTGTLSIHAALANGDQYAAATAELQSTEILMNGIIYLVGLVVVVLVILSFLGLR